MKGSKTCDGIWKPRRVHFKESASTSKRTQLQGDSFQAFDPRESQVTDMRPHRQFYGLLAETFEIMVAPDSELDTAYSKARQDAKEGLQKVREIKSQKAGPITPQAAVLSTDVGKHVMKLRSRRNHPSVVCQHQPPGPGKGAHCSSVVQEKAEAGNIAFPSTAPDNKSYFQCEQAGQITAVSTKDRKVRLSKRKLDADDLVKGNYTYFGEEMLEIPFDFNFDQKSNPVVQPTTKKRVLDIPNPIAEVMEEPSLENLSSLDWTVPQVEQKSCQSINRKKALKTVLPTPRPPRIKENTSVEKKAERATKKTIAPVRKESSAASREPTASTSTTLIINCFSNMSLDHNLSQGSIDSQATTISQTNSELSEGKYTTACSHNESEFATAIEDPLQSSRGSGISVASEYNTPPSAAQKVLPDPKKASTTVKHPRRKMVQALPKHQFDSYSETVDHNGNTITKKGPPLPHPPSTGSFKAGSSSSTSKGGLQGTKALKIRFNKASSSSSLYSSCSSVSSVAETVINKNIRLPKVLSRSRERLGSGSSSPCRNSKDPVAQLKKEEDLRRIQQKTEEAQRKKEMYILQKQEMQRKRNETWKHKVYTKKAKDAEEQSTLEDFKVSMESLDGRKEPDKYTSLMKGKINPKLFSVVSKHFSKEPIMGAASSCPDINTAFVRRAEKPRLMSQKESSNAIPVANPVKPKTKAVEPPKLARKCVEEQAPMHDLFAGDEEDDIFSHDATGVNYLDELNTYDITVYEDYDENLEYRQNKRIPDWANDTSQLKRTLFLQQPRLMNLIPDSRKIFPSKNFGEKLFPHIPK